MTSIQAGALSDKVMAALARASADHAAARQRGADCLVCGGTVLPPAVAGVERGTCYCPRGPGRIIAHLYYGTEQLPGGSARAYDVEWLDGEVIEVDPPSLARANEVLNILRAEWVAAQLGEVQK